MSYSKEKKQRQDIRELKGEIKSISQKLKVKSKMLWIKTKRIQQLEELNKVYLVKLRKRDETEAKEK